MATSKTRPETVGAIIDRLWAARERKRVQEERVKEIVTEINEIEQLLAERLEKEGLEKATGTKASVSVGATVIAQVQDWDVFWAYILKSKNTQLLQHRVSDPAYRELLELGKKVPGAVPFTKKKLNVRSLA